MVAYVAAWMLFGDDRKLSFSTINGLNKTGEIVTLSLNDRSALFKKVACFSAVILVLFVGSICLLNMDSVSDMLI